ncbi:MAG: hypothetical protein H6R40_830 [Gemmatimonadetes bacterium]|nr:hypothetical protein [Gemmatimonadota bacterium]
MTDPRVPARVDRAALERILQRAAELQAAEHDIGDGLMPDDVLALGKEVGIPAQYLRQAMLEDQSRSGLQEPSGLADETVGPTEVTAVRVVRGGQEGAERALLDWMQKNELLVVQRHQPGRITWERMAGMQAAMRRGLSTLDARRAKFVLDRADLVRATVTPLEDGYAHVSLTASLRRARGGFIGGSATLGGAGVVGSGVLVALNAVWFVALAPVATGVLLGWVVTRRFRPIVDRTLLGLERALDYVEGAAVKPAHDLPPRGAGLLELVTGELRKALSPGRPR